jgi:hypothetical protein
MRRLVGLVLWPTAAGALGAAVWTLTRLVVQPRRAVSFLVGFFGYTLLHFCFFRLRSTKIYVLGHEMTHALAAWMSGASVTDFSVGPKGGHVHVSRSNAWIALAPYMVPFYAVGVLFVYRFLLWWAPDPVFPVRHVHQAFLFAMGLALSFHLVETAEALWARHQPDLDHAGGIIFSLALIVLTNGLFLIFLLKCLFPHAVSARASLEMIVKFTAQCWTFVSSALSARLLPFFRRAT